MAPPNADAVAVAAAGAPKHGAPRRQANKPRRIYSSTTEGLQRAMSDLALELASRDTKQSSTVADAANNNNNHSKQQQQLVTAITEPPQQQEVVVVQDARCECCGMQQECTPEYARRVRDRYCGRWVCGLCAEAVNGEAETTSTGTQEEALAAHMAVCGRFNRVGRANPVLMQTQAMREILRKRSKSNSPKNHGGPAATTGGRGLLARSTSCIPAITKASNL